MKTKKFPRFTKILVFWEDSLMSPDWHNRREIEKAKATPVQSLGFFIENRNHTLKMAHSITDDAESDYNIIPWGCVQDIKLVEIKDTEVKDGC